MEKKYEILRSKETRYYCRPPGSVFSDGMFCLTDDIAHTILYIPCYTSIQVGMNMLKVRSKNKITKNKGFSLKIELLRSPYRMNLVKFK